MTIDEAIVFMQEMKTHGTKHLIVGVWTADLFEIEDNDAWGKVTEQVDENAPYFWDRVFTDLQFAVDSAAEGVNITRTNDEYDDEDEVELEVKGEQP